MLSELQKAAKEGARTSSRSCAASASAAARPSAQFRDGGRDELAASEAREAELIEGYLPAELSDEELDATRRRAVAETGATGAA